MTTSPPTPRRVLRAAPVDAAPEPIEIGGASALAPRIPPPPPPAPAPMAVAGSDAARQHARSVFLRGLVIFAVAGLVSLVWYLKAKSDASQDGSGTYFAFYGPMVYGGICMFKGGTELLRRPKA